MTLSVVEGLLVRKGEGGNNHGTYDYYTYDYTDGLKQTISVLSKHRSIIKHMREFKKRRTLGAEILRVVIGMGGILALSLVAFGATRAAWGMYGKFAAAAAARTAAEVELADLQGRHETIASDVQALSSERGVEAAARERFGVVRPGEGKILIVRQASTTEVLRQEPGWWQKMWGALSVW